MSNVWGRGVEENYPEEFPFENFYSLNFVTGFPLLSFIAPEIYSGICIGLNVFVTSLILKLF
tara:strand:+ start:93 stop:278 length:186 start_codon:yes stop_codon:yes gene_type:complete